MSPFLTSPLGLAFLTLPMMMSPSPATRRLYREALPPRTLKHMTSLAPVLSATSSRVCIWIMGHLGNRRRSGRFLSHQGRVGTGRPRGSRSGGRLGRLALAGQRLLGARPDDPDDPPTLELG